MTSSVDNNLESLEKMDPRPGYHLSKIAEQITALRKEKGDTFQDIHSVKNGNNRTLLAMKLRSHHKYILAMYGADEIKNIELDALLATAIALDKEKTDSKTKTRHKSRVYVEKDRLARAKKIYQDLQTIQDGKGGFPYKDKIEKVSKENLIVLSNIDYNLIRRKDETPRTGNTEGIDDTRDRTAGDIVDDFTTTSTGDVGYAYSYARSESAPHLSLNIENSPSIKNTVSPKIENNPTNTQTIDNSTLSKIDELKEMLGVAASAKKTKKGGKKTKKRKKNKQGNSKNKIKTGKVKTGDTIINIGSSAGGGVGSDGSGGGGPTGGPTGPVGPTGPDTTKSLDDLRLDANGEISDAATAAKSKILNDEATATSSAISATTKDEIEKVARAAELAIDTEITTASGHITAAINPAEVTIATNNGKINIDKIAINTKTKMDTLLAVEKTKSLNTLKTASKTAISSTVATAKQKVLDDETDAKSKTTDATTITAITNAARAAETAIDNAATHANTAITSAPDPAAITTAENNGKATINNAANTAKTKMDTLLAVEKTKSLNTLKTASKTAISSTVAIAKQKVLDDETDAKSKTTDATTITAITNAARAAETAIDNAATHANTAITTAPDPAAITTAENNGKTAINNAANTAKTSMDDALALEASTLLQNQRSTASGNLDRAAQNAINNLNTLANTLKNRTTDVAIQGQIDGIRDLGETHINDEASTSKTAIGVAPNPTEITRLETESRGRITDERDAVRIAMEGLISNEAITNAKNEIDVSVTTAISDIDTARDAALTRAATDAAAIADIQTQASDAKIAVRTTADDAKTAIDTTPANAETLKNTAQSDIANQVNSVEASMDATAVGAEQADILNAHKSARKNDIQTAYNTQIQRVSDPVVISGIEHQANLGTAEIDLNTTTTQAQVDIIADRTINEMTRRANRGVGVEAAENAATARQATLITAAAANDAGVELGTHPAILDAVGEALKKPGDAARSKLGKVLGTAVMIMPEILRGLHVNFLKRGMKPVETNRTTITTNVEGDTVERSITVTRDRREIITTINEGQSDEMEIVESVENEQRSWLSRLNPFS